VSAEAQNVFCELWVGISCTLNQVFTLNEDDSPR
jgi:hypothetical protein